MYAQSNVIYPGQPGYQPAVAQQQLQDHYAQNLAFSGQGVLLPAQQSQPQVAAGQRMYPEIKLNGPQSAVNPASINANPVNDFASRLADPNSQQVPFSSQESPQEEDLEDFSHLGAPPAYEEPEVEAAGGTPASAPVPQSEPEESEQPRRRVLASSHAPELGASAAAAAGPRSEEDIASSDCHQVHADNVLPPSEHKHAEQPQQPISSQLSSDAEEEDDEEEGAVLDLPDVPKSEVPKDWSPQVAAAVSNEREEDMDDGFSVQKPVVAFA